MPTLHFKEDFDPNFTPPPFVKSGDDSRKDLLSKTPKNLQVSALTRGLSIEI